MFYPHLLGLLSLYRVHVLLSSFGAYNLSTGFYEIQTTGECHTVVRVYSTQQVVEGSLQVVVYPYQSN
jgi:hypothetical protein